MSLPPPTENQAFCHVSALFAGSVDFPLAWVLDGVSEDKRAIGPALCFLLRRSTKKDVTFLFDLGIRSDWQNLPPAGLKHLVGRLGFRISVPQDAVGALAKGGLKPTDITYLCYSHLHFDHTGDSKPFTNSTVLVGAGARPLLENAYPKNPDSPLSADVVPEGRTRFLDPTNWPPVGPFPHALDFYGDGSLYIVDAGSGHFPGHVNVLARTSADGGWIYLAGDSAHHWDLITGKGKIAKTEHFGCAHLNPAASEEHIARIRELMEKNPRVRVLLAHDEPWYSENKDGPAFWPGEIPSL
ncbi:beta-lactamase-like protein [Cubamyces menziesii]|nr:beta-lactamase-like protein [Cubamyces menziesii]